MPTAIYLFETVHFIIHLHSIFTSYTLHEENNESIYFRSVTAPF